MLLRSTPASRYWPRRIGPARLAQEEEIRAFARIVVIRCERKLSHGQCPRGSFVDRMGC